MLRFWLLVCRFSLKKFFYVKLFVLFCTPINLKHTEEMQVVETKKALKALLDDARSQGKTVGLVPTMGALHAGHASLVKRSVRENDFTV